MGAAVAARGAAMLAAALTLGALLGWAAAGDAGGGLDRTAAAEIIELTNAARAGNGQAPLSVDPRLTQAAEAYAREMASREWIGHTGPDGTTIEARAEASGYGDWSVLAENLSLGAGAHDSAGVVESWLSSASHRQNILSPELEEVGVGCYVRGSPERVWCAQEFGARTP